MPAGNTYCKCVKTVYKCFTGLISSVSYKLFSVLLHQIYSDAPTSNESGLMCRVSGATLRVDTGRRSAASSCQAPQGVSFTHQAVFGGKARHRRSGH